MIISSVGSYFQEAELWSKTDHGMVAGFVDLQGGKMTPPKENEVLFSEERGGQKGSYCIVKGKGKVAWVPGRLGEMVFQGRVGRGSDI